MKQLPNILIVDDSLDNLIFLKAVLENANVCLISANSGKEALEKTRGVELALAILDVRMPEMNGYELAFKMNEERPGDKVPVIFLTANHINDEEILRGYNSGAVDYIFKPVDIHILKCKTNIFIDLYSQKQTIKNQHEELDEQKEEILLAKFTALKEAEKYFNLFNFAPTCYLTLSAETAIQDVNQSGAMLLGKDRPALIGSNFKFYISKNSLPVFNEFFMSVFINKTKQKCEVVLEKGSLQPTSVIVEGMVIGAGNQCLVNIVDITERIKAEQEIHRVNRLLDSIVENIPDMIFLKDAKDLRFVLVNRAGESLLDISRNEMVGRNDYNFFPKEQADSFVKKDKEVLNAKEMMDIPEELINTKHQGKRTLHTKKIPVLNSSGEPEYLLGISEDITDRKLVESILKISEGKYKTMLSASPDGIFLIDLNGIITEVSEIGLELLGINNKEDIVGKLFYRFVPSHEGDTIREILTKTINEGIAQNIEMHIRKKDNSLFLSETSATLIQDSKGLPFSYMVIVRDISQRKKLETKQIHADRMASLGEMATGIAHEINQPLNIISMVVDKILFDSAKVDFITQDFLKTKTDKIFENITRIRNIIDHVKDFSRTRDDEVMTRFDINTSIGNAVSMVSEQFKHLGINFKLVLDKKIPQIQGNTYRFEQVIVNLLVNAKDAVVDKKYNESEYFDMIVEIRSYSEKHFLIVEVTDNGIGIGNDDMHNIMLPFYTTKDEGKGTGLGLPICYQIIKGMNGTLEITSDINIGTKARITLDLQTKK